MSWAIQRLPVSRVNSSVCIVAIDVGNTAVKLAVRRGDATVEHSIGLTTQGWCEAALTRVQESLSCEVARWRVASVHEAAATRLLAAIKNAKQDADVKIVSRADVPMTMDVDFPDQLGIDRLLSAYATWNRWQQPSVVIDAGSAVTIDWVDDCGRYCGGVILPGLNLQSRALAIGTAALPQVSWQSDVNWQSDRPIPLPAKNTSDAIRSGILVGTAAAIDAFVDNYRELSGRGQRESVRIVLTGGDSLALSPRIRNSHQVVANLVCRGLLDLPCVSSTVQESSADLS